MVADMVTDMEADMVVDMGVDFILDASIFHKKLPRILK